MGGYTSKTTSQKIEEIERHPLASGMIQEAIVPDDEDIYKKIETIPSLSDTEAAKLYWELSAKMVERSKRRETDPVLLFAYEISQMTMANAIRRIDQVADELGVTRRAGEPDNGFARSVARQIRKLYENCNEWITIGTVFNAGFLMKYGTTPYLVKYTCINTAKAVLELNPTGLLSGLTCVGLSGYFLYMHPDIYDKLKKFRNGEYKDVKMNIMVASLYNKTVEAIADIYRGNFELDIMNDPAIHFAMGSLDYLGWAVESVEYACTHNSTEISTTFIKWTNEKTNAIKTIINLAGDMAKIVVEKTAQVVKHAGRAIIDVGSYAKTKALETASGLATYFKRQLLSIGERVEEQLELDEDQKQQEIAMMTTEIGGGVSVQTPYLPIGSELPYEIPPSLHYRSKKTRVRRERVE